MGRILDMLISPPRQEIPPPITDHRVAEVVGLLLEHRATINTRSIVTSDMWERWSQGLAEAVVKAIASRQVLESGRTSGSFEASNLRTEFQARLIDLAEEFDTRDHSASEDRRGTRLQYEAAKVVALARDLAAEMKAEGPDVTYP